MTIPDNPMSLTDWRRKVAALYAGVREAEDPRQVWNWFCTRRDQLFHDHPESPLDRRQRQEFVNLEYFAYDPAYRIVGKVDRNVERQTLQIQLPEEGDFRYSRFAAVHFVLHGSACVLSLYWVEGYGGGLFLPFKDRTNSESTYGGGRYLYDTIKGADLNDSLGDDFLLDFNFAYNPSCAYSSRWICPLSPSENYIQAAILAGEKSFPGQG